MACWHTIVQDSIIKHSDKVRKVTRPLQENFQIEYFSYHRIDQEGKYTVLGDRPAWSEHYVNEKIYLQDPYINFPEQFQSGLCFLESFGTGEYHEKIRLDGKVVLNLDVCVILIQKNADASVEFFGFSGIKKQGLLDKLYLNQPWVLKSFAEHFKESMAPTLRLLEEGGNSIKTLKHCLSKEVAIPKVPSKNLQSYLRAIGREKDLAKFSKLSKRERECIGYLLEGKSAKETALLLGLSHRTIESYFETIKAKLALCTKPEIFSFCREFSEQGLL